MSIHTVSKHLDIRRETVKNIDKAFLLSTLPALEPKTLTNLVHIGVDEVARAKGHDYMTVAYDLVSGQLIWFDHGWTSNVLINFYEQLSPKTRDGIQAHMCHVSDVHVSIKKGTAMDAFVSMVTYQSLRCEFLAFFGGRLSHTAYQTSDCDLKCMQ